MIKTQHPTALNLAIRLAAQKRKACADAFYLWIRTGKEIALSEDEDATPRIRQAWQDEADADLESAMISNEVISPDDIVESILVDGDFQIIFTLGNGDQISLDAEGNTTRGAAE